MSKAEPKEAHPKITSVHLQRLAFVYIRQSSPHQVQAHRESQANQRQLAERAQVLGWRRERIRVVDSDLGQSGKHVEGRSGFAELLAEVSLGHVGIVFGYEVSRLARNNSDWYRLLDLAAMFGTLIADSDGIYDPQQYNDRLLLGLKGTMSEAELHILHLRLNAGRLSKVRKGTYQQPLPTGLVRLADGSVVKDPNEQVRHAIELVFAKFAELGSCSQVLAYLVRHELLLPRRQRFGVHKDEVVWKRPEDHAILTTLHNPAYAGAFAYGQRKIAPTHYKPGRPLGSQTRQRLPMAEWTYLQQDVYPAYISWDQFIANQARLSQNHLRYKAMSQSSLAQGAPRQGRALLQGLVVCGQCGYHMMVGYKVTPRYVCNFNKQHRGGKCCQSVSIPSVDAVVEQAFLEAIQPAQLSVLDEVLAAQRADQAGLEQQWQDRLRQVKYEAQLAERQFNAVDPDNRLVASTLEQRWEHALRHVAETQEAYQRFVTQQAPSPLTPVMRAQFAQISQVLPDLWHTDRISNAQKKVLLRSLIAKVILNKVAPDRIEVKIVWVSGHYTTAFAMPRITCERDMANYDQFVRRIGELCSQGLNDGPIAAQLTKEGFHTAQRDEVNALAVCHIRQQYRFHLDRHSKRTASKIDGCWTTRGLALLLGVGSDRIYRRLRKGVIDPHYVRYDEKAEIYLIQEYPGLMETLQHSLLNTNGTLA